MNPSQPREILVTYEEDERPVYVQDDTYTALLEGFIKTFTDVLPVSEVKARELVRFRKYDQKRKEYVGMITPGDSTAGVSKAEAYGLPTGPVPLRNGYIYNLWSIGSYQGNGYLRRVNDKTLAADGDCTEKDGRACEWKAHQVGTRKAVYWKFSNPAGNKVMAIKDGKVVLEDVDVVRAGEECLFLPDKNGQHYTWSPKGISNNFIGADGKGNVKLILNQNPNISRLKNPVPQTLFTLFYLRKA